LAQTIFFVIGGFVMTNVVLAVIVTDQAVEVYAEGFFYYFELVSIIIFRCVCTIARTRIAMKSVS
jgi:hypothetical protein